ncbi:similar to An19g00370 [Aspergillus luchuensis IFO 4308]|nr:similar to An19g00370 [Aspergillus luchuensis IFO 4308]
MSLLPLPITIADRADWNDCAQEYGVKGVSIYDLEEYNSASKINDAQYISLRALWTFAHDTEFDPQKWGIQGVEAARETLGKLKGWKSFLEAVSLEVPPDKIHPIERDLGRFELIWYYGQLIRWAPSATDTEENINVTPWSERLRERKAQLGSEPFSQQNPPHPYPIHLMECLKTLGGEEEEQAKEERGRPSSSQSQKQESSGTSRIDMDPETDSDDSNLDPSYEERKDFPRASDETMVNAYLLGLASLITLSIEGVEAHWTSERKGYKFCDENGIKLYEARTDGHLYLSNNGKTMAIVEVKPVLRDESPRVMMQETAQMAAWIHAEQDLIQADDLSEQRFRRLLWSMNRHELYIIIAEYTADYVDYLTNPGRQSECESFLTMNQFGPWDIGSPTEIADFAAILLTVTLQFSKGLPLI